MPRNICRKNENSKHYDKVDCVVCRKTYEWVEDENADIELERISIDGDKTFLDLKVTAKCPHCNYRFSYPYSVRGDEYR